MYIPCSYLPSSKLQQTQTMISTMNRSAAPLNSFMCNLLSSKECEHITIASDPAKCRPPRSIFGDDRTCSSSRDIYGSFDGTAAIIDEVQLVLNDTQIPLKSPIDVSPNMGSKTNSKKKMRWESNSFSSSDTLSSHRSPTRKSSDDSLSCPKRKESADQLNTLLNQHNNRRGRKRPEKNATFDGLLKKNGSSTLSPPQKLTASTLARAILFDSK
jgi:hypothetical protein